MRLEQRRTEHEYVINLLMIDVEETSWKSSLMFSVLLGDEADIQY